MNESLETSELASMTELFLNNINIIQQRWPTLGLALNQQNIEQLDAQLVTGQNQTISVSGIQLSSRHDRLAEAQLLINSQPINKQKVTVYGVGMGDVPSLLIDDKSIQNIEINILNLQVFALVLHYTDQSEWLADNRVDILHLPPQIIVDNVVITITPELILASVENACLRDLLAININRQYANKQHRVDDPTILQRFKENRDLLKKDPDAASLKLNQEQTQALMIGAGPTLEQHYAYLKSQRELPVKQRPLMIAVDTALMPLMRESIVPDIVVSIDGHINKNHFPKYLPDSIKLVYFPRVSHDVLASWAGERFSAYSNSPIYDELNKQMPKLRLFTNGSVIHPATNLAIHLKMTEITFFGCDFSYPNNKTHAYWDNEALGSSSTHAKQWLINGHGEKVLTDLNFKTYLRSLEFYIRGNPQISFYQASLAGARIEGCQYKDCR